MLRKQQQQKFPSILFKSTHGYSINFNSKHSVGLTYLWHGRSVFSKCVTIFHFF